MSDKTERWFVIRDEHIEAHCNSKQTAIQLINEYKKYDIHFMLKPEYYLIYGFYDFDIDK